MNLAHIGPGDLPLALGSLQLVTIQGSGSTGTTFRGETKGLGGLPRVVAVTVLPQSILSDATRWRDLQTEIDRAAGIRHRSVVRTFSLAVEEGTPYVITELVDGVGLDALLERAGSLDPKQVLDVGIQLVSALGAAHEPTNQRAAVPLPHGELRPSAAMIGLDGVVKLRGFGLGQVLDQRPGPKALPFAAPEALASQRLGIGTDLFSLGALLFDGLTGSEPFPIRPTATSGERLAAIVKGLRGGGLLGEVDAIVPGLGQVLGRLLSLDPSTRFQKVAEAEAALREIRGGLPRARRLSEVLIDCFGRDLGLATGHGPVNSPVSTYINVDPALTASKPPLPRSPEETVPPAEATGDPSVRKGPLLSPGGQSAGRDSGVPAPPPVAVSRRELVAAPRDAPSAPSMAPSPSLTEEISLDVDEATTDPGRMMPGPARPEAVGSRSEPTVVPRRELPPRPPADRRPDGGAAPVGPTRAMPKVPSSDGGPSPASSAADRGPVPAAQPGPRQRDKGPGRRAPTSASRGVRTPVLLLCGLVIIAGLVVIMIQLDRGGSGSFSLDAGGGERTELDAAGPAAKLANQQDSESLEAGPLDRPAAGSGPADGGEAAAGLPDSETVPEVESEGATERTEAEERAAERRAALAEERRRRRAERSEEAASDRREEPEAEPRSGTVELQLTHRPIREARPGASALVSVTLAGPRKSKVVLHYGPAGGPYRKKALRAKSGKRWEGWMDSDLPSGATLEYWVVGSHPAAKDSVRSGSRSSPHRVSIR
ncbi:MAG: protein kinase [Myxococcota bacterium]|nr:protein kinase [Myxococcota bacterium]